MKIINEIIETIWIGLITTNLIILSTIEMVCRKTKERVIKNEENY